MLKRYWGVIFTLGIAFIGSALMSWLLWPAPPVLHAQNYESARSSDYNAGGSTCSPKSLATLGKGREATSKRDACAKEAEEYRLQTNDLIQQTRAASAAEAQAELAAQGAWLSFFQTVGGFLTLVAAGAAAIYARDAATETRKGSEAADRMAGMTVISQRAYLDIAHVGNNHVAEDGCVGIKIKSYYKNFGATPALNIRTWEIGKLVGVEGIEGPMVSDFTDVQPSFRESMVSPEQERTTHGVDIVNSAFEAYINREARFFILLRVEYNDIFEPEKTRYMINECEVEVSFDGSAPTTPLLRYRTHRHDTT